MISIEANERLTQVSSGTPMGKLLRRYWHPIAATVESISILKEFREIFEAEALPIDSISTHGNAASVYFRDPEGNRLEVYYSIPVEWPQPFRKPINLDQDDDAVLQQIHDLTFGATVK